MQSYRSQTVFGTKATTLLRQIQEGATESKESVAVVLRRAQILAARLDHGPLKDWVGWELNGYPDLESLPDYRVIPTVQVLGDFSGPLGAGMKNAPIAPASIPEEAHEVLFSHAFFDPIAELESLAQTEGTLQAPWPTNLVAAYGGHMYQGYVCMSANKQLTPHGIAGVIDQVRNRLLAFALEIEAEAPDAGEAEPGEQPVPEEKVSQIVNTTIYGGQNTVAAGSTDVAQQPVQVQINNWGDIEVELGKLGVPDAELRELQQALASDGAQAIGPETQGWLGRLAGKVGSGSVVLAEGVTVEVVAEALARALGVG